MDREYHEKCQVVFLIDKSLEHTKEFLNHRHDHRCNQCDKIINNNPEDEGDHQQQQSSLNHSSNIITCDCGADVVDIDQSKSRVWKSISLSALRILCYLFSKSHPRRDYYYSKKTNNNNNNEYSTTKSDDEDSSADNNNSDEDNQPTTATVLQNQIEYLKAKQSSLQWGYKFFNSNKLPGKTEHNQLKDFKLRHFEEFEKELEKQFEELNDDCQNTTTETTTKTKTSSSSSRRQPAQTDTHTENTSHQSDKLTVNIPAGPPLQKPSSLQSRSWLARRKADTMTETTTKTKPSSSSSSRRTSDPSSSSTAEKSNAGPTPSECLKRTLSHVLYDFSWENPDITSPLIFRKKSSLPKKRKRSSPNSSGPHHGGIDGSAAGVPSGPKNLVFLFQSCPSSKMELRHFAGKVVVDSEVLLDSFMPPSLFKEFAVSRNLSLYWVDHQIHDDISHMDDDDDNVPDSENESFQLVNEALAKLRGTLIPLDSLTLAGSVHWSSIYFNTRWAKHLFLDVNSPEQPSQFGNFLDKKKSDDVNDDDFPPLPAKASSKSKNKRSKYQDKGRALLPITSVLDHFIRGRRPCPATSSTLIKDGAADLIKRSHIEATLAFDQNETLPELCPLTLVPTNSSCTGTLEKFFTRPQLSNPGPNVHVSMTDEHRKSREGTQPDVEFILSKPQPCTTSASSSSSPMFSTPQESISLQLEVYSYLSSCDVCSTSDYVFFCTASIQSVSKFGANRKADSPNPSTPNTYAKFQSLLLRLAEADQNLVLTVKLDGQSTPFLAVLQPFSVSVGLIVFFPMGLSLNLEKHLLCKSSHNVTKDTNSAQTFQIETDRLDYLTDRYAKKLLRSKYTAKSLDMQRSGVNAEKEVSKLNVFDSAVLNKWSLPSANNPEMIKMSMNVGKNVVAADPGSSMARETDLFKQLKSFYRQADSPSELINKKQQQEEEKKLTESLFEESTCQNAPGGGGGGEEELKPRLLQKLRSFTLGPTRAEMILSKSMQVVQQLSKVVKEDNTGMSQSIQINLETQSQVAAVVKAIGDDSSLGDFITGFYDLTITDNLNSWNRMHRIVAIAHTYMKERGKKDPEAEAKQFLEKTVYLSSSSLRQKYQDAILSTKKQDRILEYQLQIILRMEMLLHLKLLPEEDTANEDDDEQEDSEETTVDIFVEEIVTMLRTLSFITDAALVPVFLNDVLLKHYSDTLVRPLAEIYNQLMQPLPSVLATSIESPESSIQSSFCPSTVSIYDETARDGFPEIGATQAKRAKTMQVVPGLGEGVKRQIVVGKKPATTAKRNNLLTKDAKDKKREEESEESNEKEVRARRSLFMSEKKTNLERHRSFAVRDKDKSRSSHRMSQRHSHRRSSKHPTVKSSSAQKGSKSMVAETPAHKQQSHVMRRWHLLQNRLTEPLQKTESPEIRTTPKGPTPATNVSIIEESPVKEGFPVPKSENCKKTTVLIKRGFYGSQSVKSQSRNLTKYLELADRIAGRHDRYAQLTDLSIVSQMNDSIQSPVDKPSTFALSQLMGSPSSHSPKARGSPVLKYTPNRKSPAFPFSTSPKYPSKTLERISVKQALFKTPEKTVAKSLVLQSPTLSSPKPCSTKSQTSVRSKLALFNSPTNGSKCIFKTPTKEPLCLFKSPNKTPTFKKFNTTPVKSIAQASLSKLHKKQSGMKGQLSDGSAHKPQSSENEARNDLIASHHLSSKSSLDSDTLGPTHAKCPKSSDTSVKFSSKNCKFKKLFSQDDNNNSTTDTSSVIPLHSSPPKSSPFDSLSECSAKSNKRKKRNEASQPDAPYESKDSICPPENLNSSAIQSKEGIKPLAKQKRKRVSEESVSEDISPLISKRPRRSLARTLHKH